MREHLGLHWVRDKAVPFDRSLGNPLRRLGADQCAVCTGVRADHWVDGRKVGENSRFVPVMAAQRTLGVWLPAWAGPAERTPVTAAPPPDLPRGPELGFTNTAAALLSLTALFAYLNHRFVRLPPSVGVMPLALAFSLLVTAAGLVAPGVERVAAGLVRGVDFNRTVLHGMLGFCSSPGRCTSTSPPWPGTVC